MRPHDRSVHEAGERVAVPKHYAEMCSWKVAAELVRRHPEQFVVIETHPGGGQYDCLSIYERQTDEGRERFRRFADLNRGPRGHITSQGWGVDTERLNWLDVLFSEHLRDEVIIPLERADDLASPRETPLTTSSTVGVRLIAELLAMRVVSRDRLTALNGVIDGSYGAGIRNELFSSFPSISSHLPESEVFNLETSPAYRYWFVASLKSNEKPPHALLAIDTWNGLLWFRNESSSNVLDLYREHESDITNLASVVLSRATCRE